jgi:hypothetical protein
MRDPPQPLADHAPPGESLRRRGIPRWLLPLVVTLATLLLLTTTCLGEFPWPTSYTDSEERATDSPDGAYRAYIKVRDGFLNTWYSLHVVRLRTATDATVTDLECYEIGELRWAGPRLLEVQLGRPRYPHCQPLASRVFDVDLHEAER